MSEKFHYLAEGAYAIEPLIELAESKGVSIPVYRALYEVLLNKKDPSLLIETIKNPDRFDELYFSTKIQISGRKKGLEKIRGRAFRELITSRTAEELQTREKNRLAANSPDEIIKLLRSDRTAGRERIGNEEARLIDGISRENYNETVKALSGIVRGRRHR